MCSSKSCQQFGVVSVCQRSVGMMKQLGSSLVPDVGMEEVVCSLASRDDYTPKQNSMRFCLC